MIENNCIIIAFPARQRRATASATSGLRLIDGYAAIPTEPSRAIDTTPDREAGAAASLSALADDARNQFYN